MNKELKEIGKQLKELLDKYPHKQKEILFYIFGEDTIRKILNKPTYEELETSIATKDGELLQLKEELRQLKTNRDEAIKEIKKRSTPEVAQLYIEILEKV